MRAGSTPSVNQNQIGLRSLLLFKSSVLIVKAILQCRMARNDSSAACPHQRPDSCAPPHFAARKRASAGFARFQFFCGHAAQQKMQALPWFQPERKGVAEKSGFHRRYAVVKRRVGHNRLACSSQTCFRPDPPHHLLWGVSSRRESTIQPALSSGAENSRAVPHNPAEWNIA